MSLKPSVAPKASAIDAAPPIENEIPTYRAISPLAVAATVLGAVSALSFTGTPWLIAAVLAVVAGILADRSIKRRPDALTGRSFAQAGIAMGLTFGVASFGHEQWTDFMLRREATAFAKDIIDTLNAARLKEPVDSSDAVWFMVPPGARKGMTPGDAKAVLAKMFTDSERARDVDMRIKAMSERAGKDHPFALDHIEDAFYNEMSGYAMIIVRVDEGEAHAKTDKAASKAEPEGAEYAMLKLRQVEDDSKQRWFMEYLFYPYVPHTYKHVEKVKIDDGHGH